MSKVKFFLGDDTEPIKTHLINKHLHSPKKDKKHLTRSNSYYNLFKNTFFCCF